MEDCKLMIAEKITRIDDLPYWCVWRSEIRDGKPTKIPYSPLTGDRARANDPTTFSTRQEAEAAFMAGGYAGVGFLVHESLGITVIDLDGVVAEDGSLSEDIQETVDAANTYAEGSPSGTGIHLIWGVADGVPRKNRSNAICRAEGYTAGRFMSYTGNRLPGTPEALSGNLSTLRRVLDRLGLVVRTPEPESATHSPGSTGSQTNRDVLDLAFGARNGDKIRRLDSGDISDYPSHSEADMAFVGFMSFYTQDPAQLASLLAESGLAREKTQRGDYVARTVQHVLDNHNGEMYTPLGAAKQTPPPDENSEMDWEPPIPLDPTTGPPFPIDALPGAIGEYVAAVAEETQTPLDMAGSVGFGTLSAACGGKYEVVIPDLGWREPVHVMSVTVAEPGTRKSGVIRLMTKPIVDYERDVQPDERRAFAQWESQLRVLEKQLASAENDASKKGSSHADN